MKLLGGPWVKLLVTLTGCSCAVYSPTLTVLLLFSSGLKLGQGFCPCLTCRLYHQPNKHQCWHSQFPCGFVSPTLPFPCSVPLCCAHHLPCQGSFGLSWQCRWPGRGCPAPPAVSNTCHLPLERTSIGMSLLHPAADLQDSYNKPDGLETLALPPALVKSDQQIQKLSGTEEWLAHKSLIALQTMQCLKPDLVLTIYAQSCCLAAAAHVNLSPVLVLHQHAFTSAH